MSFVTLKKEGFSSITEKKSEFKGYAVRITSEEEAKSVIEEIKKKEKGARHNVFAYITGGIKRYSDDGEPQGTGGIPVLSVLEKQGLSDALIVVTRYFGGILLGASGLSRAYGMSAKEAADDAGKVTVREGITLALTLPYDVHARISGQLSEDKIQIIESQFTHEVKLTLLIQKGMEDDFISRYKDLTGGTAITEKLNSDLYFEDEDGNLTAIPGRLYQ